MPAEQGSSGRRYRLGAELRKLREQAGLSADQVGEHLLCAAWQVRRFESGYPGLRPMDLEALLDLYGVSDVFIRASLLELAEGQFGWGDVDGDGGVGVGGDGGGDDDDYGGGDDVAGGGLEPEFVSVEAHASEIREFQPLIIPGQLQTEAYAKALVEGRCTDATPEDVARGLDAYLERLGIFARDEPPKVWAVIGEAALRQEIGGREVMAEQMAHLLDVSEDSQVVLQVLPYSAGAHPGVDGAFSILSFPNPEEKDVILANSIASQFCLETEPEVGNYILAFVHIRATAMGIPESREFLRRMMDEYQGGDVTEA
ncbi:helix-turn-helix domain-containing protein [Streptomyces aidingensis]|uniref:Helix-turn-helix domain-containing protein n=1 Tax=Streptomyces aidingensis TaxID=910347 RepID=A0A1I1TVD4_9ACTN|nr:helix-turn-helix transcriptional regulator [Streptomyces aidingensis]SFD62345.1 Helix-turn-helix domain-containing protein [Streptomyces aidingensis]